MNEFEITRRELDESLKKIMKMISEYQEKRSEYYSEIFRDLSETVRRTNNMYYELQDRVEAIENEKEKTGSV
jgi:predicted DNA-binding protein YlxM (UPF0122 family)